MSLVPSLAPETLHHLIRHFGVEGSGELIAAATPEQVRRVLDLDLWRASAPGGDSAFDANRFADWIEALVDYDVIEAARIVVNLDARLVVVGLSKYIRVLDPGTFEPTEQSDDERPVTESPTAPQSAVGGYTVHALRGDAWDAVLALLGALESGHAEHFHVVMRGCRRLSDRGRELDGLDDLFETPDQWRHDIALDREARRTADGYSTPAEARAFLQLARKYGHDLQREADAYFRAIETSGTFASGRTDEPSSLLAAAPEDPSIAAARDAVVEWLADAGLTPERPRALLAGVAGSDDTRLQSIRAAMTFLSEHHDAAFYARTRELAFLTNALISGCSLQGREFTPAEASEAVFGICNLGLEVLAGDVPLPPDVLATRSLISAFEAGWSTLYDDVALFAARSVMSTLGALRIAEADMRRDVHALRMRLRSAIKRGTPWQAREHLDMISPFDTLAWTSLAGLFSECPVVPAALTATLERQTGAISPSAFAFMSTRSQILQVHQFLERLPELLGG